MRENMIELKDTESGPAMNSWLLNLAVWLAIGVVSGDETDSNDGIPLGRKIVQIKEAPYVVSLQTQKSDEWAHTCGGSLVSSEHVITACHCVADFDGTDGYAVKRDFSKLRFVAGTSHLEVLDESSQNRLARDIKYHPRCEKESSLSYTYDIAIAEVEAPFDVSEYVKPVVFPPGHLEFDELVGSILENEPIELCTISGWGHSMKPEETGVMPLLSNFSLVEKSVPNPTNESSTAYQELSMISRDSARNGTLGARLDDPERLRTVNVMILPKNSCDEHISTFLSHHATYLTEVDEDLDLEYHQFCIVGEGGDTRCEWDDGSGLICRGQLVAVSSLNLECGTTLPAVSQKISVMIEWMEGLVGMKRHPSTFYHKDERDGDGAERIFPISMCSLLYIIFSSYSL